MASLILHSSGGKSPRKLVIKHRMSDGGKYNGEKWRKGQGEGRLGVAF